MENKETSSSRVIPTGFNIETLYTHLMSILNERDQRYAEKFTAAEKAVTTAFASSEKASLKAEQAQESYNVRSNEFRGQLDDQAKTLMPRLETDNRFGNVEDKIYTSAKTNSDKIEELAKKVDIISTRLTTIESKGAGMNSLWGLIIGGMGLLAIIITLFKAFSGK
jgi:hypothetical protein